MFREVAHGANGGAALKIAGARKVAEIGSSRMHWLARLWKRRDAANEVAVHRGEARLDDRDALERLLAPLPEAEDVRSRLHTPFFARAWDARAQLDYWISSDGTRVTCYTLRGLSLQQAAEVRVKWDALQGRTALTEDQLAEIVARQTGKLVTLAS